MLSPFRAIRKLKHSSINLRPRPSWLLPQVRTSLHLSKQMLLLI